jgi:hypothetical protein
MTLGGNHGLMRKGRNMADLYYRVSGRGISAYNADPTKDSYSFHLELESFKVLRRTTKGAWIVSIGMYDYASFQVLQMSRPIGRYAKFVLDGKGKRFAYQDIDNARNSFRIRRLRYIEILEKNLEMARATLEMVENGEKFSIFDGSIKLNA